MQLLARWAPLLLMDCDCHAGAHAASLISGIMRCDVHSQLLFAVNNLGQNESLRGCGQLSAVHLFPDRRCISGKSVFHLITPLLRLNNDQKQNR
jgi:hypothetical protein